MPNLNTEKLIATVTTLEGSTTAKLELATDGEFAGKYVATFTADDVSTQGPFVPDGYFPVKVNAEYTTGAKSEASVSNPPISGTADDMKLHIVEKHAPSASIVAPGAGATLSELNDQIITCRVVDNVNHEVGYSGIKGSTVVAVVDGTKSIGWNDWTIKTPLTDTYGHTYGYDLAYRFSEGEYLADGTHTVTFNAQDVDGNSAAEVSRTFIVNVSAPSLSLETPTAGQQFSALPILVSGTTSDEVSAVTVRVYVDGNLKGNADIVDGRFTFSITSLTEGNHTIKVIASDGYHETEAPEVSIYYSDATPKIKNVRIVPATVDGRAVFKIVAEIE